MTDKKFQRFGKYLILDHLVDGGMAKICRARYLGEQANKVVAIKMVQPQFSNDEAFVRMFQDELNITFGMLHPNIMQVYDYGKTNSQLYTAMEYIHGANLKQFIDRLKERKVVFPVEISCYIISQVCLGLHYAHTFTDKLTGKPYNIVHRDISPHNIMLTYDGAVKVIDFGIAKANTNSEATQAGTIKGKLSYLAPEYLDGLELDARYDEFAVGITLWELLCSRKLFQANNDLAVLKQIQACKITPPSQINPLVPKELDEIVMKALSKDRAHRYEDLDKLNRALIKFLYSTYPDFNASDLKGFAVDLFKNEIGNDREKFVEYGRIDIIPYIDEMKKDQTRTSKVPAEINGKTEVVGKTKVRELELAIDPGNGPAIEIDKKSIEKTGTRKLNRTTLHAVKSNSKNSRTNGSSSRRTDASRNNSRLTNRAQLKTAKEEKASGSMMIMILVASITAIAYFQADLVEGLIGINLKKLVHGEEVKRDISSVPKPSQKDNPPLDMIPETSGKAVLGGLDVSMELFVNGTRTQYMGRPIKLPLNEDVFILVKKSGYMPYSTTVRLSPKKNSMVINIPPLQRARIGLLTTSQNYTAGSKLVFEVAGELVEREMPFKDVEIPQGVYQAKVVNPILGTEKRVEFSIEESKKHFLE
jgi:eukaryotic-like serine/threonine-protein kinase